MARSADLLKPRSVARGVAAFETIDLAPVRIAQLPPSGQALIDAARQRDGDRGNAERGRYFLTAEINRD